MTTEVLYSASQIKERIKELGKNISDFYKDDKPILCVCVLKGAFMFFSELVKYIKGDVIVDFITLSSYGENTQSSGNVKLVADMREQINDRHVLIVEDIIDTGNTVKFLREYFASKNALSVKVACLIDKPMTRKQDVQADYTAFTMDSPAFIVGYGLDYDQKYRNYDSILEVRFD